MYVKNNFVNLKNCLFFFLFIIATFLIPSPSKALPREVLVQDIMEKLDVSREVADAFLIYIRDFVYRMQNNFTDIASHETSGNRKRDLIEETLSEYFEDPMGSEVQVSSLKRKRVKTHPAQVYLTRLSNLDNFYGTVKLYFDKTYLSMGKIKAYNYDDYHSRGYKDSRGYGSSNNMGYEFSIQMWQMFEGCRRDNRNICYKDFTKKGFHFSFVLRRKGWLMRVFSITADKTVSAPPGDVFRD